MKKHGTAKSRAIARHRRQATAKRNVACPIEVLIIFVNDEPISVAENQQSEILLAPVDHGYDPFATLEMWNQNNFKLLEEWGCYPVVMCHDDNDIAVMDMVDRFNRRAR